MSRIVCVDFDGVIFRRTGPWVGPADFTGAVVAGAERALIQLVAAKYCVVIHTSRALDVAGREAVKVWLKANGFRGLFSDVTAEKVGAHAYLDDRAVPFRGDWAEALRAIHVLKPWTAEGSAA